MIREKKFARLKQIVKKTLELCSCTLCNGAKILVRLIFYFLCPVYIDIFSEIWPMLFKGVLEIPNYIKTFIISVLLPCSYGSTLHYVKNGPCIISSVN